MNWNSPKGVQVVERVDALAERVDYLMSQRLAAPLVVRRADSFDEGKHPRASDGKFGSGGGGGGSTPSRAEVVANRAKAAAGGGGGTSSTLAAKGGGRLNTTGNAQREAVVAARKHPTNTHAPMKRKAGEDINSYMSRAIQERDARKSAAANPQPSWRR